MQKDHKQQSRDALANLKELADRNGVTNVALSEKIGVRPQTVGQMFRGKWHPTLDNVYRALNAVNDLSGKTFTLADIDGEQDTKPCESI